MKALSPVTGEFPAQRPVTRSFGVFFDLRLNKRLSKQSWDCDFKRHRVHYEVTVMFTNIAAIQNMEYYNKFDDEIYGDILLICQNTTMRVYGAWIKRYCVLWSKTYSTWDSLL